MSTAQSPTTRSDGHQIVPDPRQDGAGLETSAPAAATCLSPLLQNASAVSRTPDESSTASLALSPREGATTHDHAPPATGQSAAAFLKDPPAPPAKRLASKKKGKGKRRNTPGSLQPPATAITSGPAASPQQQAPLKNTPTSSQTALSLAPESGEPAENAFTTVLSRNAQRRARALQAATIPVDPAVVGTALFRPSGPGGAFERGSRLAVAAVLSALPGVSAVRVNTKRNIVAADATSQACLEELLATTELRGIPVAARPPAVRGNSTGFIHGIDGETTDAELAGAIESSVPILSATRSGNKAMLRFSSPVPPEHVSIYKLQFRVRPGRPRPLQCQRCGRYGHVAATCDRPTSCLHCGRSHERGESCPNAAHCNNCGGNHPVNTPACPRWQEERRVATIMVTAPTSLSRRAVRASVREETQQAKTSTQFSYAQALTGRSRMHQSATLPPGQPPKAAPRTLRAGPSVATTTITEAPATPPPQACPDPRDQLIASLQLTLKAIGEMLPADSPLRALCLQTGGVPSTQHQHG
nr:serine/arginine repetitive matrix protein 2-like [Dermacentor andersoni]